ncbi:glycosyltransferase family 61 protein, partial [Candidatus Woesearchaeota archaeon]|nr:glycosyltransferase family 61 protein [Candidatus Woesearchaeota archaeon]
LREPLGFLEKLFPERIDLDIRRSDISPKAINRMAGCRVPIGSRKISARIQARVVDYLARVSGPEARRIEQDFVQRHRPVFWLSVRDHDRTCRNQVAFLAALASGLLQAYPDSGILLDGFAFAPAEADLDTLLANEQRAIQVAGTIEQLKCRIGESGRPQDVQRVCSVSGLDLLDNLYLARFADYYVCHAGTLQHKLGWLYKKPGVMHTYVQSDNACRSIAAWYAHQVEEGVTPGILPPRFISTVDEDPTGQPARNKNYWIQDIPGVIDFILEDAATIPGVSGKTDDTLHPESSTTAKASHEYRIVLATQPVSLEPPVRLDTRTPAHPRLTLRSAQMPGSGVAIIPGGKACLELPCQFFDATGREVGEVFDPVARRPGRNLPVQGWHRLEGRVCPVVVPGGGIFAHWLGDVLPALHLVQRAGVDFASIDHWILNRKDQAYHRESLQKLGIPAHKVIAWSRSLRFVEADEWVVPGRVRKHLYTAPWIIEWLRATFVPDWPSLAMQAGGLRLYLSRGLASKRQVLNETEVVEYLKTLDFQVLHLENLSLTETAHLLTRAGVVVAPHGAGLANMVFCKPGTRLIELYSWHISQEYWMTAQTLGLDYANLACPGPDGRYYDEIDLDYTRRFAEINSADIQVDVETLGRVLATSLKPVSGRTPQIPPDARVAVQSVPVRSACPPLPPVFIFAACWRTGSTLLQRVLNASDELMIWGEPGYLGLMRRVYDMLTRQTAHQEKQWNDIRETGLARNWLPNLAPRQE